MLTFENCPFATKEGQKVYQLPHTVSMAELNAFAEGWLRAHFLNSENVAFFEFVSSALHFEE